MRPSSVFGVFAALSSVASAQQTPAQIAAELPTCVDACDSAAIAAVGCGETDYACHCSHTNQIKAILLPCLQNSSSCTGTELQTFAKLVPQICVALNNTENSTTSSPSGTSTPNPSGTMIPFTGDASKVGGGLVGLVGVALLAWMI